MAEKKDSNVDKIGESSKNAADKAKKDSKQTSQTTVPIKSPKKDLKLVQKSPLGDQKTSQTTGAKESPTENPSDQPTAQSTYFKSQYSWKGFLTLQPIPVVLKIDVEPSIEARKKIGSRLRSSIKSPSKSLSGQTSKITSEETVPKTLPSSEVTVPQEPVTILVKAQITDLESDIENSDDSTEKDLEVATEGDLEVATEGDLEAASEGDLEAASEGELEAASEGDLESATEGDLESATEGDLEFATGDLESATEGDMESATEGDMESATEGDLEAATDITSSFEKMNLAGDETSNLAISSGKSKISITILENRIPAFFELVDKYKTGEPSDEPDSSEEIQIPPLSGIFNVTEKIVQAMARMQEIEGKQESLDTSGAFFLVNPKIYNKCALLQTATKKLNSWYESKRKENTELGKFLRRDIF